MKAYSIVSNRIMGGYRTNPHQR